MASVHQTCANLCRIKLEFVDVQLGSAFGEVKNFHAHNLVLLVKIQNHARRHFLRLDNFRVIQSQVERIRFFVNIQFSSGDRNLGTEISAYPALSN